jgi:dihydropteroate synthase
MHMHRDPQTMQAAPMEGDVVPQVLLLFGAAGACLQALGVEKTRIVLDPGIGFGKTVAQNFALLARQRELLALRLSRAGRLVAQVFVGRSHGLDVEQRLHAQRGRRRAGVPSSAARASCACTMCAKQVQALAVWQAEPCSEFGEVSHCNNAPSSTRKATP